MNGRNDRDVARLRLLLAAV